MAGRSVGQADLPCGRAQAGWRQDGGLSQPPTCIVCRATGSCRHRDPVGMASCLPGSPPAPATSRAAAPCGPGRSLAGPVPRTYKGQWAPECSRQVRWLSVPVTAKLGSTPFWCMSQATSQATRVVRARLLQITEVPGGPPRLRVSCAQRRQHHSAACPRGRHKLPAGSPAAEGTALRAECRLAPRQASV